MWDGVCYTLWERVCSTVWEGTYWCMGRYVVLYVKVCSGVCRMVYAPLSGRECIVLYVKVRIGVCESMWWRM